METSKGLSVSLSSAVKTLNKILGKDGKEVNVKNMAVGLLSEEGVQRKLAFVYLDGKDYWCVFLNGGVEKYSSLSIGDVLISLFFLSSLVEDTKFNDGNHDYILCRQGEDILLAKQEPKKYQHSPIRGC